MKNSKNKFPLNLSTIVVGAGAHVPYGFPTSQGLTSLVKKIYGDPSKVTMINALERGRSSMTDLQIYKHELAEIARLLVIVEPPKTRSSSNDYDIRIGQSLNEFLKSFCESQVYSIDTYLSKISKDKQDEKTLIKSDWGRLIVSYLISHHERQVPFGTQEFDWIQFIIDRYIKNNLENFFKAPPNIITFNYDRFFERCIYKNLVEYHGISESEAKARVESLPIVHVYGKLGCFTRWEVGDKKEFFRNAINNIQVIGEHRSNEQLEITKTKIKEILDNTQKTYFLGYGFDEQNNTILVGRQSNDWHKYNRVVTTNIGLKRSDIISIASSLGFTPGYIGGADSTKEVYPLDLFRELEPLEKDPSP